MRQRKQCERFCIELQDKLSWLKREIVRMDGVGENWLNNLKTKERNLTGCINSIKNALQK